MKIKISKKTKIASTIALVAAAAGLGFLLDNLHRREFVIDNIPDSVDNAVLSESEEPDVFADDEAPEEETEETQETVDEAVADEPDADDCVINGKVNINIADADILVHLDGIGASTAQNIIEYREQHGSFKTVDDLVKVNGIGGKKLEELREFITVE